MNDDKANCRTLMGVPVSELPDGFMRWLDPMLDPDPAESNAKVCWESQGDGSGVLDDELAAMHSMSSIDAWSEFEGPCDLGMNELVPVLFNSIDSGLAEPAPIKTMEHDGVPWHNNQDDWEAICDEFAFNPNDPVLTASHAADDLATVLFERGSGHTHAQPPTIAVALPVATGENAHHFFGQVHNVATDPVSRYFARSANGSQTWHPQGTVDPRMTTTLVYDLRALHSQRPNATAKLAKGARFSYTPSILTQKHPISNIPLQPHLHHEAVHCSKESVGYTPVPQPEASPQVVPTATAEPSKKNKFSIRRRKAVASNAADEFKPSQPKRQSSPRKRQSDSSDADHPRKQQRVVLGAANTMPGEPRHSAS